MLGLLGPHSLSLVRHLIPPPGPLGAAGHSTCTLPATTGGIYCPPVLGCLLANARDGLCSQEQPHSALRSLDVAGVEVAAGAVCALCCDVSPWSVRVCPDWALGSHLLS